jgi:hypothetical protein
VVSLPPGERDAGSRARMWTTARRIYFRFVTNLSYPAMPSLLIVDSLGKFRPAVRMRTQAVDARTKAAREQSNGIFVGWPTYDF